MFDSKCQMHNLQKVEGGYYPAEADHLAIAMSTSISITQELIHSRRLDLTGISSGSTQKPYSAIKQLNIFENFHQQYIL